MASTNDHYVALGAQLIEVHGWLRRTLDRLRQNVDRTADEPLGIARPLRAHCLALCAALTSHRTAEGPSAFPALAARAPELAAVLEDLERDHDMIADIVRRVERLMNSAERDTHLIRAELDGLAAILESHFRWEERRLVPALDTIDASSDVAATLRAALTPPLTDM